MNDRIKAYADFISKQVNEDAASKPKRIKTDSGTANISDTHVSFNNSGYKQKFTHDEIAKMDKGEHVRGFYNDKKNYAATPDISVYTNDEEDHHLPNSAKKKP